MTMAMDASGAAALAIVESLLLALNDRNVLPEREILLPEADDNPGHHAAVAALINKILAGGNSVRRRKSKGSITTDVALETVLRTGE